MLTDFFNAPHILKRLRSLLAGPYLDDFTDWLTAHGYAQATVRLFLYGIDPLDEWMRLNDAEIPSLDASAFETYREHLNSSGSLRYDSSGKLKAIYIGARHFQSFLIEIGVVPDVQGFEAKRPMLLEGFCQWMVSNRGVRESTLTAYGRVIVDLIDALGDVPTAYEARSLRKFVLDRSSKHGLATAKATVTATRVFLRFLIATGSCRPELEGAVPVIADWHLASLPQYLVPADIERLIASCDERTITMLRDRAILLLLWRLALRAGDVADLTFADIDWSNGTIRVSGKGRREDWLPLPQEVGDAVVAYLRDERPQVASEHLFVKAIAPHGPVSSPLISTVVRRASERADIEAPSRGAHLLRHSAATAMLREGATLHEIASVLRHVSIETTNHYAKVDSDLLRMVATPWPEVTPC